VIDMNALFVRLFELGSRGEAGHGAALFHAVLAEALAQAANRAASDVGALTVALGGGCFFNKLLTERVRARLHRFALEVVLPETVNCGDAGLALGQAWVAEMQLPLHPRRAWASSHPAVQAVLTAGALPVEVRPCA
jgi:hydrogenase maturation protein HypF